MNDYEAPEDRVVREIRARQQAAKEGYDPEPVAEARAIYELDRENDATRIELAAALVAEFKQPPYPAKQLAEYLAELRELASEHPQQSELRALYAHALSQQTCGGKNATVRKSAKEEMDALFEAYGHEINVLVAYANTIAGYRRKGKRHASEADLKRLRKWANEFPEHEGIRAALACSLVDRCERAQHGEVRDDAFAELHEWADAYRFDPSMQQMLLYGIRNLFKSAREGSLARARILCEWRELIDRCSGDGEVRLEFGSALIEHGSRTGSDLTVEEGFEEKRRACVENPDNLWFLFGLADSLSMQAALSRSPKIRAKCKAELEALAQDHSENKTLAKMLERIDEVRRNREEG